MADIFISYSRKDSEQANLLTELLTSAGLSVWIDRSNIEVATSWSGEITKAITECKAFVVMLSPASIASLNVRKEVSLASERQKKILPLDLEAVGLPDDLAYHLAGIQRAPMTNIDAVIRALGKLGLEATQAPSIKLVKEADARKSLMILPFEDMSPTGDNGWFADGLASELISALSNVKALRVADPQATKDFKRYQGTLPKYAHEMGIRYFVQGDVRKFGDQIKITTRLLDVETGDFLWQDSMKGTMHDIFDIQERVAENVVKGLKIHLAGEEKKKLTTRGTENAEAYELYLKGNEFFNRGTKEGFEYAVALYAEAIALDSEYVAASQGKANTLIELYRNYDRNPAYLTEAEELCRATLSRKPDTYLTYSALVSILALRGNFKEAEALAAEYIHKEPNNFNSHFTMAYLLNGENLHARAIPFFKEAYRLSPFDRTTAWNLAVTCFGAQAVDKGKEWASIALPLYEQHLRLHPDDEVSRVHRAFALFCSDRAEEARAAALELKDARDGYSLVNLAGLFSYLKETEESLDTIRLAIESGFKNTKLLRTFLTDKPGDPVVFFGTPGYEDVLKMVDELEADEKGKPDG